MENLKTGMEKLNIDNSQQVQEVRNILLIGSTGGGKSTLANVILGEDRFKESEGSVSETKNSQVEIVEMDGITYRIIDTIGVGDTVLKPREVLYRIGEAANLVKEGLHQVLFVVKGRFTEQEVNSYDLLRTIIFDEDVVKYTTVVRTNFPNFGKPDRCSEDKNKLIAEGGTTADIIKRCHKMLYVDNPPVDIEGDDEYSEMIRNVNKMARAKSRERLMTLLYICKDAYRPENLNELNARVGGYMTEKEQKEYELLELKIKMEREEREKEIARWEAEASRIEYKAIAEKEDSKKSLASLKARAERELRESRRIIKQKKERIDAETFTGLKWHKNHLEFKIKDAKASLNNWQPTEAELRYNWTPEKLRKELVKWEENLERVKVSLKNEEESLRIEENNLRRIERWTNESLEEAKRRIKRAEEGEKEAELMKEKIQKDIEAQNKKIEELEAKKKEFQEKLGIVEGNIQKTKENIAEQTAHIIEQKNPQLLQNINKR